MKTSIRLSLVILSVLPGISAAASMDQLRTDWAHVRYEVSGPEQLEAMTKLKEVADMSLSADPTSAELLIWDAIITSSLASLKRGLGGLSLAKEARARLEQAEKLQPGALRGSGLIILGALYYQVPAWPVGFGDKGKARASLQAALKIDPDSIDANFFYADFLRMQGDRDGARRAAEHALSALPRPGREVADNGRRAEARALIAML